MDELFAQTNLLKEPLASRMRPQTLDEYIGQDHIVGRGRLLRRAIAADQLTSVIFYGPPGSGKTTLARVIANHTKSNFITLNAVLTGVADIRNSIKQAEDYYNLYSRRTILFVDEVHRWNKAQQDALLPWVENGTIILIGATTENPFFEVNKALVSRSRVFQLKPLTKDDLKKAADQALKNNDRGYGHWNVEFEEGALEHLIDTANGDARSLLNALELAVETTPEKWNPHGNPPEPAYGSTIFISKEAAEESIQKKVVLYDRDGDYHYDIISAFIKSLRGRDPDGAMYWLARMVRAGEDPHFIFRRMLISACEDTGLADPMAIAIVTACEEAFDRVGLPEGRYHLAHAALYLSTCPKSNSSMAFFDALSSVESEDAEVPNHLKDSSRDAEGFGHGSGYLYPHAYRDHWVAQQYLPDALMGRVFYTPSTQGYENEIRNDVLSRRELQIAAILEKHDFLQDSEESAVTGSKNNFEKIPGKAEHSATAKSCAKSEFGENPISQWWINEHFKSGSSKNPENLTFTPVNKYKETALDKADKSWQARIDSNRAEILLQIRDIMTQIAVLSRHDRSLIWNADDGLLLWEIARKTPEGATCGVCRNENGKQILEQYSRTLGNLDKPILEYPKQDESLVDMLELFAYKGIIFDHVFFRNPFANLKGIKEFAELLKTAATKPKDIRPLADGFNIVIAQKIPCHGQRISQLIASQVLGNKLFEPYNSMLSKMEQAEKEFFGDRTNPLFNWDCDTIVQVFKDAGFNVAFQVETMIEKRRLTKREIANWFNLESSAYADAIAKAIGDASVAKLSSLLENASETTIFNWETEIAFLTVSM
ncbi:MAG: AAA family ATPase [Treponema sp.]|uniref:AAA family ATPase n=1 Tax=Treponema sp. TaxID=166 RepID=UPI00298EA85D|nr:AAA family ATPase [Treponema sp.]MDD5810612.1 AAA family ATPase [Treponema sp.]